MDARPALQGFICFALASRADACQYRARIVKDVEKTGGTLLKSDDDVVIAAFPTVAQCLALEAQIRSNSEAVAIGVTLGESSPGTEHNAPARGRCEALARLAHLGQTLVGPAAREVARQSLPPGFRLIDLGETFIGNAFSAERVYQLDSTASHSTFPPLPGHDFVPTNIASPPDGFIGREAEAKLLRKELVDHRLVTLTGPGGVGKSTLARWVGYDLADSLRDGAWRVNLSSVPSGGNLAGAIAADLKLPGAGGISAEERILFELATMDALLVLDNCEHLIPEAEKLLPILLACCPKLMLLVTSREPLACEGGRVVPLKPLSVPVIGVVHSHEHLMQSDSVRLFVARISRSGSTPVSDDDLPRIAKMCQDLDGLPLAIELAAAQAAQDGISAIERQIASVGQDSPKLELAGRPRSLESAIGWSYARLKAREQRAFQELALLDGVWACDTALDILGKTASQRVFLESAIHTLAKRSLLESETSTSGGRRYRMLRPIRTFAIGKLKDLGSLEVTKASIARATRTWVARLRAKYPSLEIAWQDRLASEYPIVRSALDWHLAQSQGKTALDFFGEMYHYWIKRGPYSEGADFIAKAIAGAGTADADDLVTSLRLAGTLACYGGDYAMSESLLRRSIEIATREGLDKQEARTRINLGIQLRNAQRPKEALESFAIAAAIADKYPDVTPRIQASLGIAMMNAEMENVEASAKASACIDEWNAEVGNQWFAAGNHYIAGMRMAVVGNTLCAEAEFTRSIELYRAVGDGQGLLCAVERMGMLAIRVGNYPRAARLLGGSESHFRKMGVGRPPGDALRLGDAVEAITAALGEAEAEAHMLTGALLSLDELFDISRVAPPPPLLSDLKLG